MQAYGIGELVKLLYNPGKEQLIRSCLAELFQELKGGKMGQEKH